MFEYISAKVALAAAALLLLSSTIGMFSILNTQAQERECQSVVDDIADAANSMQGMNAAAEKTIEFGNDGGDALPDRIGGLGYRLVFRQGSVLLAHDGKRYSATFLFQAHLFRPEGSIDSSMLAESDAAHVLLEIDPFSSFIIERKEVDLDSGKAFATFIYPEHES